MASVDHSELMNAIGYKNSESSYWSYPLSSKSASDQICADEASKTSQKSSRGLAELDLDLVLESDNESKVSPLRIDKLNSLLTDLS